MISRIRPLGSDDAASQKGAPTQLTKSAFVDELYQRYLTDPNAVSEPWREFFHDYQGPKQIQPVLKLEPEKLERKDLRQHAITSADVATVTSSRTIAVKVLEENCRLINAHQATVWGPPVSFAQIIAWALAKALLHHPHLDSATIALASPSVLGTVTSIPRLLPGQSLVLATGSIGYPAEYSGMSAEQLTDLGLSKVMTLTSTYDYRLINAAEAGELLKTIESLLHGAEQFYHELFADLSVRFDPFVWLNAIDSARAESNHRSQAIRPDASEKQANVLQMIRAYRVRGHLRADIDPLGYNPKSYPDLDLAHYGLTVWDLDKRFLAGGLASEHGMLTLREITDILRDTYCRQIGAEFMHMSDPEAREWLRLRMERTRNAEPLPRDLQLRVLSKLNAAEALETFLHKTYAGHKRFSLEGAETLIPMLDVLLHDACEDGVQDVIIGMAHRGRLNVLANIVGKSYDALFREFEGHADPTTPFGSGDVKYHLGAKGSVRSAWGRELRVEVASNPSHLEAVDPVVEGMVRARQDMSGDSERKSALPVLLHGDAAFSGQGVVAETFHLSELSGYRTGGTVHIVINNQIGFTTGPHDARSSHYATDVAKMVRAPVLHVNADHPEAAIRAMRLAFAFRQMFRRDIVIDLVCYRRWGHNETDDPSYTHPTLYAKIEKHRSTRKLYTERLLRRGDIDMSTAERMLDDYRRQLATVHDEVRKVKNASLPRREIASTDTDCPAPWETPCPSTDSATLNCVLEALERVPDGFTAHPKLLRQLARRRERFTSGHIDWALAEALAFGSLVLSGVPVRLSGEDSGRGTFSQRHAILYDHKTSAAYTSLDHIRPDQARFNVYDSSLSEFAVLGFEYGYSLARPEALVLWEAQFGDFVNGAQVIIDQFISSAEDKWDQRSAVTLLLPHGYEGQGPEHSSARFERFLQLAAKENIRVVYPSTPAQYFHVLRKQAYAEKKPLIILTPKSLLRAPNVVSTAEELSQLAFAEVIDDASVSQPDSVRKLILCSGKIFHDLNTYRSAHQINDISLVRVEQLYPLPNAALGAIFARYAQVQNIVWAQEEPRNMGAWMYLNDCINGTDNEDLMHALGPQRRMRFIGRSASASPATGSQQRHAVEQDDILKRACAE